MQLYQIQPASLMVQLLYAQIHVVVYNIISIFLPHFVEVITFSIHLVYISLNLESYLNTTHSILPSEVKNMYITTCPPKWQEKFTFANRSLMTWLLQSKDLYKKKINWEKTFSHHTVTFLSFLQRSCHTLFQVFTSLLVVQAVLIMISYCYPVWIPIEFKYVNLKMVFSWSKWATFM